VDEYFRGSCSDEVVDWEGGTGTRSLKFFKGCIFSYSRQNTNANWCHIGHIVHVSVIIRQVLHQRRMMGFALYAVLCTRVPISASNSFRPKIALWRRIAYTCDGYLSDSGEIAARR